MDDSVVVVGGGHVGIAAALALANGGRRVQLIERAPRIGSKGTRVLALNEPSRRLLLGLGVWRRLQSPVAVRSMRVFSPSGRELRFNGRTAMVSRLCSTVREADLSAALREALESSPVEVYTGAEVESLSLGAREAAVETSRGSFGASLVVGADGQASRVASLARLEEKRTDFGHTAVVADLEIGGIGNTAWQWMDRDGVLALLPAGGDRAGLVWSLNTPAAPRVLEDSAASISEALAVKSKGVFAGCALTGEAGSYPVSGSQRSPCGGRVVLAGDSYHAFHPLAGQGLATGFGDVADLLEATTGKDPGRPSALAEYRRRRELRVGATQTVTSFLAGLLDSRRAAGAALDAASLLRAEPLLALLANAR